MASDGENWQFLDTDAGRVRIDLKPVDRRGVLASVSGGAKKIIGQVEALGEDEGHALERVKAAIAETVVKIAALREKDNESVGKECD